MFKVFLLIYGIIFACIISVYKNIRIPLTFVSTTGARYQSRTKRKKSTCYHTKSHKFRKRLNIFTIHPTITILKSKRSS